ncbi:hypothetical protein SAMN05421664_0223 [Chryseobacterium soldanellicola]|uniref:C1q domain-containing protein n=1 Tax=Chryseobacterium soldanellicola TaxID=311333 RepID=A0A1H0XSN9_9FLAO|nr:hypothetical protein [Chryseobacterium soldanellicola]SDQ05859.1 hypothetical protein SAMN05421664_0223 [Chryseobacterium soldanellicola]
MKKITFSIVVTLLSATIDAQVGINTTTPHAPLQFQNETVNRKIVMYETANNDHQVYGFGVNPGVLRYQTDAATSDHAFFSAASATASNELMRIKGTGNVGIATSAPLIKLDIIGNSFGMRSGTDYGGWDNIWFNITKNTTSINTSGAEQGLQFNVGSNPSGNYGDGQTLATVATMLPNGNMGVGTTTPQKTLHVNGALQITNELNVGGNATTAGRAGTAGQVLTSNGPGAAPTWNTAGVIPVIPSDVGTVIAINGQLQIAQEIVTRLVDNWTIPVAVSSELAPIQQMTDEIIDNKNKFTGSATTNTFTVESDGVYYVSMNFSLQASSGPATGNFRFGVYDAATGAWVGYAMETLADIKTGQVINLSSNRTLSLVAGRTYTFAVQRNPGSQGVIVMRGTENTAATGNVALPITVFSVKRLK